MDLNKAIQQLYAEKERLERVIASLEELQRNAGAVPALTQSVKRRGRKFMDPEERQEVSNRMKKYWAARRKEQQKHASVHGS
ncbi:MAG: hypothetical protein ABSG79_17045 [Bryobacteraceae bacterium]|jgi:hypothetical protein